MYSNLYSDSFIMTICVICITFQFAFKIHTANIVCKMMLSLIPHKDHCTRQFDFVSH